MNSRPNDAGNLHFSIKRITLYESIWRIHRWNAQNGMEQLLPMSRTTWHGKVMNMEFNSNSSNQDRSVIIALAAAALLYVFKNYSPETILVRLFVILVCIPIHEYAHARSAYALGDDTAQKNGRVTLNPFSHLSLEGALLIFVFGFGYGKPVPVGTYNFPEEKRKRYYALTALAGPFSNLLLSLVFLALAFLSLLKLKNETLFQYLSTASYININLAVFNMIPIPPLDGSSLLNLVLPDGAYGKLNKYRNFLIVLILASTWILPRFGINIIGNTTGRIFRFFVNTFADLFSKI